jgi:hypothetical protein
MIMRSDTYSRGESLDIQSAAIQDRRLKACRFAPARDSMHPDSGIRAGIKAGIKAGIRAITPTATNPESLQAPALRSTCESFRYNAFNDWRGTLVHSPVAKPMNVFSFGLQTVN